MSPKSCGIYFPGIGQARTGGGPLYQESGYLIARLAAFDALSSKSVQRQLRDHWMIDFAILFMRLKAVAKADLSSKSLRFYSKKISDLHRVLNNLKAPQVRSCTGAASDLTPEYMVNHTNTTGGVGNAL